MTEESFKEDVLFWLKCIFWCIFVAAVCGCTTTKVYGPGEYKVPPMTVENWRAA